MLEQIQQYLDEKKAEYNYKLGQKQIIYNTINTLTTEIDNTRAIQAENNNISALLQKAAEVSRGNTKEHLENVCTAALKYVFGKDVEFIIDIQECRGRPEAEFYIQYTTGKDVIKVKPEDASGGGVIDVLSTALRFAFLELLREPSVKGPIILDEPGKMISEVAANRMASLLQELQQTFNRQTIMVTHSDIYEKLADKSFEVMMNGNHSKVIESSQINYTSVIQEVQVDEKQMEDEV